MVSTSRISFFPDGRMLLILIVALFVLIAKICILNAISEKQKKIIFWLLAQSLMHYVLDFVSD
jgi:hypothetical protein